MRLFSQLLQCHLGIFLSTLGAISGVIVYFVWPNLYIVTGFFAFLLGVISLFIGRYKAYPWALFPLFVGLFIFISGWHESAQTPFIITEKQATKRQWVTGQVVDLHITPRRDKVVLDHVILYHYKEYPRKIRISAGNGRFDDVNIGDWLSIEIRLNANRAPAYEGDFDFGRYQRLKGIDASGFVMGNIYQTTAPKGFRNSFTGKIDLFITRVRQNIAAKLSKYDDSGVSVALLTGIRSYLLGDVKRGYQQSGLAHVLAISGLHLGIIGGLFFFGLRRLLAYVPYIALRYNTKKIAATVGLIATFGYMLLAGSSLPTVRAFIMIGLLFVAVLMERFRLSVRVLCVAALIVLTLWPESLLTASFQMSFAATFALVLWAENMYMRGTGTLNYIKGVLATSFVAGLATLPIAAAHFSMVSFSGFFLNLVAIPLLAFILMPLGILTLFLMIFGLEAPAAWAFNQGVQVLNMAALWGANSVAGGIHAPFWLWPVLLLCVLIILGAYFYKKYIITTFGLAALLISLWVSSFVQPFDIFVLREGKTIGLRVSKNIFALIKTDGSKDEKYILNRFEKDYALNFEGNMPAKCDSFGCVYKASSKIIFVPNEAVTAEDCTQADIILTKKSLLHACPKKGLSHMPSVFIKF